MFDVHQGVGRAGNERKPFNEGGKDPCFHVATSLCIFTLHLLRPRRDPASTNVIVIT